jgi:hypothetical protein
MNARTVTLALISSLLGLVAPLVPAEAQQMQRVYRFCRPG